MALFQVLDHILPTFGGLGRVEVEGVGFMQGLGFGEHASGVRASRVQGSGCRVQGVGLV